ncbi:hypothetical protein KIF59_06125 [Enterobacter cloacae subsp. cloacae]|nr:hypothetical protein [Enterobacter cloacae subsp. cloacae]
MQEIVTSVAQVTRSWAKSPRRLTSRARVSIRFRAVNEMDLVTQQNAAMVEEAAMAAGELESAVRCAGETGGAIQVEPW